MGAVYEGEQPLGTVRRKVAVKTLHPHLSRDPKIQARFEREVATISELEHPNTIQVYDFGSTPEGILYFVMEFLHGGSVADRLAAEGAMEPRRASHILEQVCGSLEEAHGRGIVHRDLKPDNVVLVERAGQKDFVKVLDFGIAKRTTAPDEGESRLTQQGMVVGTPPYMSPEQFAGRSVDARSDIYSLGVMAYEMLTGKLPFKANTAWEWAAQHLTSPPIPIESLAEGRRVPPSMREAIRRALAKSPEERFQTVRSFMEGFSGSGAGPDRADEWMSSRRTELAASPGAPGAGGVAATVGPAGPSGVAAAVGPAGPSGVAATVGPAGPSGVAATVGPAGPSGVAATVGPATSVGAGVQAALTGKVGVATPVAMGSAAPANRRTDDRAGSAAGPAPYTPPAGNMAFPTPPALAEAKPIPSRGRRGMLLAVAGVIATFSTLAIAFAVRSGALHDASRNATVAPEPAPAAAPVTSLAPTDLNVGEAIGAVRTPDSGIPPLTAGGEKVSHSAQRTTAPQASPQASSSSAGSTVHGTSLTGGEVTQASAPAAAPAPSLEALPPREGPPDAPTPSSSQVAPSSSAGKYDGPECQKARVLRAFGRNREARSWALACLAKGGSI